MFKQRSIQSELKKQLQAHYLWIQQDASAEMKLDDLQFIGNEVEKPIPIWNNVADSLRRIALWHGANGLILINEGESGGWDEIHRSCKYLIVQTRLRISELERRRKLNQ